ncbi:MAG: hypothetical protein PUB22_09460 [Clostridiales bacterium]|nr:hypothetical protein [Clostridiales bacterium]
MISIEKVQQFFRKNVIVIIIGLILFGIIYRDVFVPDISYVGALYSEREGEKWLSENYTESYQLLSDRIGSRYTSADSIYYYEMVLTETYTYPSRETEYRILYALAADQLENGVKTSGAADVTIYFIAMKQSEDGKWERTQDIQLQDVEVTLMMFDPVQLESVASDTCLVEEKDSRQSEHKVYSVKSMNQKDADIQEISSLHVTYTTTEPLKEDMGIFQLDTRWIPTVNHKKSQTLTTVCFPFLLCE